MPTTPEMGLARDDARQHLIFEQAEPECVTIIPTYRCNAACAECCFESNASIRHRMTRDELLSIIHKVAAELPHVRYVVLTGGEITLLRDDLLDAIQLLTRLGLGSRIVTNGHWARSDESASRWVQSFCSAGLHELNLSTGDEHQEWVPFSSVARAALHAVRHGLTTVIVVEGQDQAGFTVEAAQAHEDIRQIYADDSLRARFILMSNIWMPFHEGARFTSVAEPVHEGCDNIFENFVVNPYGHLMSCCGLTMEHIPELKVGNAYEDSLAATYRDQYTDVFKLWIWLDGTRFIFDQVAARCQLTALSPHPCALCAQLYRDEHIRDTLLELLSEHAESIIFRAAVKARMAGRSSAAVLS